MFSNKLINKTILIVEDDVYSYELLKEYFLVTGAKIIHAKTGVEAIKCFKKQVKFIDLILMDIKLPQKNGLSATQEIRLFNKNIPIVAQTASVAHCEIETYLSSGMNAVISKPYRRTELLNIVLKYLPKTNGSKVI